MGVCKADARAAMPPRGSYISYCHQHHTLTLHPLLKCLRGHSQWYIILICTSLVGATSVLVAYGRYP